MCLIQMKSRLHNIFFSITIMKRRPFTVENEYYCKFYLVLSYDEKISISDLPSVDRITHYGIVDSRSFNVR